MLLRQGEPQDVELILMVGKPLKLVEGFSVYSMLPGVLQLLHACEAALDAGKLLPDLNHNQVPQGSYRALGLGFRVFRV